LGLALGISFTICFITGLTSHLIQHPPGWFEWPARPAWLYRVTQGLHVTTGLVSVPLLLAKLWTVYPHFWTWPPIRNVAHLVERIALVPLVAGSLFLLFSGVANISLWYPWRFFFPAGHYSAAWITIGALIVHIGAKARITRRALSPGSSELLDPTSTLGRRGFLALVGSLAGVVAATTVGQTLAPLRGLALLAPRLPDVGPQGFPVNKTALSAGVEELARDPNYRLMVTGNVERPLILSREELAALPQTQATLSIACVEGWSATAQWEGVRVSDLLARAGARPGAEVTVESLQPSGLYKASELNPTHAADPATLLALRVNGEILALDHGYPLRLIGPNRPGVMQTKWVSRLVVS
jgi:DMSO/TMAO reductase YedYZ molybdopterin-dependent catalytic subunit